MNAPLVVMPINSEAPKLYVTNTILFDILSALEIPDIAFLDPSEIKNLPWKVNEVILSGMAYPQAPQAANHDEQTSVHPANALRIIANTSPTQWLPKIKEGLQAYREFHQGFLEVLLDAFSSMAYCTLRLIPGQPLLAARGVPYTHSFRERFLEYLIASKPEDSFKFDNEDWLDFAGCVHAEGWNEEQKSSFFNTVKIFRDCLRATEPSALDSNLRKIFQEKRQAYLDTCDLLSSRYAASLILANEYKKILPKPLNQLKQQEVEDILAAITSDDEARRRMRVGNEVICLPKPSKQMSQEEMEQIVHQFKHWSQQAFDSIQNDKEPTGFSYEGHESSLSPQSIQNIKAKLDRGMALDRLVEMSVSTFRAYLERKSSGPIYTRPQHENAYIDSVMNWLWDTILSLDMNLPNGETATLDITTVATRIIEALGDLDVEQVTMEINGYKHDLQMKLEQERERTTLRLTGEVSEEKKRLNSTAITLLPLEKISENRYPTIGQVLATQERTLKPNDQLVASEVMARLPFVPFGQEGSSMIASVLRRLGTKDTITFLKEQGITEFMRADDVGRLLVSWLNEADALNGVARIRAFLGDMDGLISLSENTTVRQGVQQKGLMIYSGYAEDFLAWCNQVARQFQLLDPDNNGELRSFKPSAVYFTASSIKNPQQFLETCGSFQHRNNEGAALLPPCFVATLNTGHNWFSKCPLVQGFPQQTSFPMLVVGPSEAEENRLLSSPLLKYVLPYELASVDRQSTSLLRDNKPQHPFIFSFTAQNNTPAKLFFQQANVRAFSLNVLQAVSRFAVLDTPTREQAYHYWRGLIHQEDPTRFADFQPAHPAQLRELHTIQEIESLYGPQTKTLLLPEQGELKLHVFENNSLKATRSIPTSWLYQRPALDA